jgi:monoamine oxidase
MSTLAMAAKQAHRGPDERRLSLRLEGGAAVLDVAARNSLGGAVRLSTPIVAVEHDAQGVTVETRAGERVRARVAVIALPPAMWRALAIWPVPGPERREALAALRPGHVVKAHLVYGEPWWRESSEGGLPAATDLDCGLVYEARIGPDGAALTCFVGGEAAQRLYALPPAARPGAILSALEAAVGQRPPPPRALRLDAWNEARFTAGSYLVYRLGELTRHRDALARAEGRLVAAGSEASSMPSYIGGAAEAGVRAADQALAVLG